MKLLITGGAGFIGSNFIRYWLAKHPDDFIINMDKLTYAGHLSSTKDFAQNPNYKFVKGDICNANLVNDLISDVNVIVHFAAESHVDRSVIDPLKFIKTNILGTAILLNAARSNGIERFHLVSTDEVFGQLSFNDKPFSENTPFAPRTPYAVSKASADLLVKSYFSTYGFPVTITNCANNYGSYHDPEKLIPRFITNLIEGKKVPLMGKGENIREWLFVEDHARAIEIVLLKGKVGESYCVGGFAKTNLEVTREILSLLGKNESSIEYVGHRLGHDLRYAINDKKLRNLGWRPQVNFKQGLQRTIEWYVNNQWWWKSLLRNRPVLDRVAQKSYSKTSLTN